MRHSVFARLILACAFTLGCLTLPAFPQAAPKQPASESPEAKAFREFIVQHPKALAELKKDPSLVSNPEFIKDHPVVGKNITAHPKVKDIVRANPKFFENLNATTAGGEHGMPKKGGAQKKQ